MLPYKIGQALIGMVITAIVLTAFAALIGMDYATHSILLLVLLFGYFEGWVSRTYFARQDDAEQMRKAEMDAEYSE